MKVKDCVLVFECYYYGKHSKRMALSAKKWFGAGSFCTFGHYKQCFAIPTAYRYQRTIDSYYLKMNIDRFIDHARLHSDLIFLVTRIGTDLAGYSDKEMSPLFKDAPPNCILPKCWNISTCPSHEIYQINKKDLETEVNVTCNVQTGMDL